MQHTSLFTMKRPTDGSCRKAKMAREEAPQPALSPRTAQRQLMPFLRHRSAKLPATRQAAYPPQVAMAPLKLHSHRHILSRPCHKYELLQRPRDAWRVLYPVISPASTPELLGRKHIGEDWNGEYLKNRAAQRTYYHPNKHHVEVLGTSLHSKTMFNWLASYIAGTLMIPISLISHSLPFTYKDYFL